ncbi:MAG TPA: DUF695 domain-containing protein [Kofleriaceae bacterium]|nr:DUF695 domain-containing protein [Kofleriaceae bacterium]
MVSWEQDFDFYMAQIEDQPASFVIDLAAAGQAPLPTHPLLLSIRVPMLRPRADGLRDASELDELGALEDQFVEALATKVDAAYVGRTVHAGATTLYLYVPEAHRDALDDLPGLTGAPPGDYQPEWGVVDDPAWDQYLTFLAPDEYAHQSIWNRRLLKIFSEDGDQLDVAREIDHMAFFPTKEAADQAAAALAASGFRVDPPTSREQEAAADAAAADADADTADADEDDDENAEGEGADDDGGEDDPDEERWALQFHRDDVLADGRPDEFVAEILDIILPLDGTYDGWGAEQRRPEEPS